MRVILARLTIAVICIFTALGFALVVYNLDFEKLTTNPSTLKHEISVLNEQLETNLKRLEGEAEERKKIIAEKGASDWLASAVEIYEDEKTASELIDEIRASMASKKYELDNYRPYNFLPSDGAFLAVVFLGPSLFFLTVWYFFNWVLSGEFRGPLFYIRKKPEPVSN